MPDLLNQELRKVTLFSVILMGLTSVHHLYGAIAYHTSWRLHVLLFSIPVIVVTLLLHRAASRPSVFWLYWIITLLAAIILIGIFEGLYNHVLKNILFFSGFPKSSMEKLYPRGAYEMPDNLFFEISGILQGIIAIPLIIYFIRLTQAKKYKL